ncbi:MAG: class I SAM-dependent methyltransferase [Candidatus Methanomethyliaceae archaeon]|nr:class I SAM-dependent methyltransferase [Candidatus Methanomethyliaceae archaeon]
MREELLKLLKKSTTLNRIASKIYWKMLHIVIRIEGSEFYERRWLMRHTKQKSDWEDLPNRDSWVKDYWESKNHPHRNFLVQRILRFAPIESILEVGSNCGPNLYLLAKFLPLARIIGVDINPVAVNEGNKFLKNEGISNVKLICSKADDLDTFKDKSFDIVFTDAVLIYIGPDKIEKVIKNFVRIARKTIILLEWHSERLNNERIEFLYKGKWVRDYKALFERFGFVNVKVEKIPEEIWPDSNWKIYGTLITIYLDLY